MNRSDKSKSKFISREEQQSEQIKEEKINKIILTSIILFLVALVILVILVRRDIEIAKEMKPSLITISAEKKDAFPRNTEVIINYNLMPDHIDGKNLNWISTNPEVADFTKDNTLKTSSIGQTLVYAELSGIKSNELNIIVANYLEDAIIKDIPKQIEKGKSFDLNIELSPADSVNTDIRIESSDDKILTVRDKALFAQKLGTATITIKDSFNNILRTYEIQVIKTNSQ